MLGRELLFGKLRNPAWLLQCPGLCWAAWVVVVSEKGEYNCISTGNMNLGECLDALASADEVGVIGSSLRNGSGN